MSDGRVYFIRCGVDGPIKIWFSRDVPGRLRQLQTGQPQKLRVLRAMRGDPALEAWLHRRFAAHRLDGEWFAPHPELLSYIIDNTLAPDERPRPVPTPAQRAADAFPMTPMDREELARQARAVREMLAAKAPKKTAEQFAREASNENAARLVEQADVLRDCAAAQRRRESR